MLILISSTLPFLVGDFKLARDIWLENIPGRIKRLVGFDVVDPSLCNGL